jgi:hypothetical protein
MGRSGRKQINILLMVIVAIASWLLPGAGYFILKEKTRAVIIFVTILLTFAIGLYIGSIGVINPVDAKPWYVAQLMNSPFVALLGRITSSGQWSVYGRPAEIGQIYTSISGILNLLCIVKAVQSASVPYAVRTGGQSL